MYGASGGDVLAIGVLAGATCTAAAEAVVLDGRPDMDTGRTLGDAGIRRPLGKGEKLLLPLGSAEGRTALRSAAA